MTTTPNMNITPPTVQVTAGPLWASMLNAAFDTIDTHDHSSGKGVPITPAGLNINADLDFASNNAIGLRSVRLTDQGGSLSGTDDLGVLYNKSGELAYRDLAGNEVVITSAGSVAGVVGSISGLASPASASFSSVTNTISFYKDSSKPAKMNISDILVYEYDNASANPITIKSPASLAAAYSIILPTGAAGAVELLNIDGSGQMNHATLAGTAGQITVTQSATAISLSLPATVAATTGYTGAVGSAAAPTYAFATATTTGIYGATNLVGLTVGGTRKVGVGTSSVTADVPVLLPDGSTTLCGVGFSGQTNTGLYRSGSTLNVAIAGTQRGSFSSSGLAVTGALSADSLNVDGGGAFKVSVFTGSATAQFDLSIGATVYGVMGTMNGTALAYSGDDVANPPTGGWWFGSGSPSNTVRVKRTGTTSSTPYRIVVFHA